ncbi:TonB-dependent receptor [Hymenobacter psoromatis]
MGNFFSLTGRLVAVCVLLLLSSFVAGAQTSVGALRGTITTAAHQPVPFATVAVLNSALGATADQGGHFSIANVPAGRQTVVISSVGYATHTQTVEVTAGQTAPLTLTLTPSTAGLDEVVVTAQKDETTLQQTPMAVSALGTKQLREYRVWDFKDLTALAPNLFVIEHANSTGGNFLNIRGVMGFTNEQAVATYVDGVYQFDYFSAPTQLLNVERIEVLRGPQGTLYGRNALGGVVNIVTRQPTNTPGGYAEVSVGDYGQRRYSLAAQAPLVKDKLFLSLGGQYGHRQGIFKNLVTNSDFDEQTSWLFNGTLRYLATDRLSFALSAYNEHNNDRGAYPWVPTRQQIEQQPWQIYSNYPNTERRRNFNASLKASYHLPGATLTSVTGFQRFTIDYPDRYDFDFTAQNLISGEGSTPQRNWTQELRVTSDPSSEHRLSWTVGAFGFRQATLPGVRSIFYLRPDSLQAPPASSEQGFLTTGSSLNRGIAGFGQLTYQLTDRLSLTGGLRYDYERRELVNGSAFEQGGGPVTVTQADTTFTGTYRAWSPKAIVSYQASANVLAYASYARGFRAGGLNTTAPTRAQIPYQPEASDNYELGLKTTLPNQRARLNLALFYLQQRNQQIAVSSNGLNSAILNVGKMNNFGAELEAAAVPVKGLELSWNAAYNHARYAALPLYNYAENRTQSYAGNQPINTPVVTSMLAAQYTYKLGQGPQPPALFVRGEWRYLGPYYFDYYNQDGQGAYGLFNTRAGVSVRYLELAFWVRNVFERKYITYGSLSPQSPTYMQSLPRLLGTTLTARF